MLAVAAPDPHTRGLCIEVRTDSKVLIEAFERWRHERNERWKINHPLAVALRALDGLRERRGTALDMSHVRAHWAATEQADRVLNAVADGEAKAAAAGRGSWASAPAVDLRHFDPHYSVLTTDSNPLGLPADLHVAGGVSAFIKAQTRRRADHAAVAETASEQTEAARQLGPARLRAAVRAARSRGLTRAGQVMAMRLASGTLPTFAAVRRWFLPGSAEAEASAVTAGTGTDTEYERDRSERDDALTEISGGCSDKTSAGEQSGPGSEAES